MRTYTEDQVAAIIERAVERQREADAGAPESGLTLDEIERLGREAGIDPAHLRAAASEVDTAGRTLTRQTGQTRTEVIVERWIDKRLTVEAWEDIVERLRQEHGMLATGMMAGNTTGDTIRQIGDSYEWMHTNGLGIMTRVMVSPRDGRTRLRMTQLVGMSSPTVEGVGYGLILAIILAVVAAAVAAGMTDGVASVGLTGALAFVLSWLAAAPTVTALDRRWRAKKLRRLDALADDLVPLVRDTDGREVAPAPLPTSPASAGPLLDLDGLADDVGESRREQRRTRS